MNKAKKVIKVVSVHDVNGREYLIDEAALTTTYGIEEELTPQTDKQSTPHLIVNSKSPLPPTL